MEIILSVAVSLDGYIDDSRAERLRLSSEEDFYDVHALRSQCDGVMVGAGTIRKDNSSLVTKHAEFLSARRGRSVADDPIKVTLTRSFDLPYESKFFQRGDGEKWVLCGALPDNKTAKHFGGDVKFLPLSPFDLEHAVGLLEQQGIGRLLVEGGTSLLTQFLQRGLCDRLRLAVCPFFVGDKHAPRFVDDGSFVHAMDNRAELLQMRQLGDVAVLDYALQRQL